MSEKPSLLNKKDIYEYYDRPLIFVGEDENKKQYLVVLVGETKGYDKWFAIELSEQLLDELKDDTIDMHDAFIQSKGFYAITEYHDETKEDKIKYFPIEEIPKDLLPEKEQYLLSKK